MANFTRLPLKRVVDRGFFAARLDGKPKSLDNRCLMVLSLTFSSRCGRDAFTSAALMNGFFFINLPIKQSVLFDVFLRPPEPGFLFGVVRMGKVLHLLSNE